MKNLSTLKQILVISYSVLSIVLGLMLAWTYNSFEFLIPIVVANMSTFYIICNVDDCINWKGLCMYFASLFVSFSLLHSFPSPSNIDELRLICMDQMAGMCTIVGILAGGIARYKIERHEKRKEDDEGDEGEDI